MAQFQFNSNDVDGNVDDRTPLPPGRYQAIIDKTEMGAPNANNTVQLMVEWGITDGPHKDRKVRNYVTVECPKSDKARDIGLRFLKNVCESVGIAGFTDTDELCNRPHIIEVAPQKDKPEFSEVKRTYPAGAGVPVSGPPPVQQAASFETAVPVQEAPKVAPTANVPPWARK